jgi:alpha-1,3-rhamnosyl/mannosyltransferase
MACGCPVVAANTGALPEIAADAATYCDPLSPDSIGAAIRSLVCDQDRRSSQSAKGIRRAAEFTWERTARDTLEVFRQLA